MRRLCGEGARKLIAMPAGTPSLRLLADQTARVLVGLIHALDAVALLTGKPDRPTPRGRLVACFRQRRAGVRDDRRG
jgi:hypothetical protein